MNEGTSCNDQMTTFSHDLLAYCLVKQGRGEDALSLMEEGLSKDCLPDKTLFLGHLCTQLGQWEKAMSYLMALSNENCPDDQLKRVGSDCLLHIAVNFSEQQYWDKTLQCLSAAQSLCPDNPSLMHVPANMESDLPAVFFKAKDYAKAIEIWEKSLKDEKISQQKTHLLAIAYQCMFEESSEYNIKDKINFLQQAHMHWTALSVQKDYWRDIFKERTSIYGASINEDYFLRIAPEVGVQRCLTRLSQLQADMEAEKDKEALQIVTDARVAISVEQYSAKLILEACKSKDLDWPKGGLKMLTSIWGSDRLENALSQIVSNEVGSPGWLIKGLKNEKFCLSFVHYLHNDFIACIHNTEDSRENDLNNLMGLAMIRRAEIALEGQQISGCQDIANKLSRIPDSSLRNKAQGLLEKLVSKRLKAYLSRDQRDEAITFLYGILNEVQLKEIKDKLSALLLQRSERLYIDGDIDGFLNDFHTALQYAKDRKVCNRHLQKIVSHRLNELFEKKDFQACFSFLERLRSKYPDITFLDAQYYLFQALQRLEGKYTIGDRSVFNLLEKAYNADKGDKTISGIYANALTSRAVRIVNDDISSYSSVYSIRSTLNKAETMLLKALEIDPNCEEARKNLLQLMELKVKVRI